MASSTNFVLKEKLLIAFKENEMLRATCQEVASEIQSGHIKLYAFVEELGPFVTDQDVSIREKGISMLSSVLMHLPKDFLSNTELNFITSFYCDRLKDHHSIIPSVLNGILAIVRMYNLPKDSPARLLRVLFEHVQCQSQQLSDRHNIYMIFITLLQNRIEDLKAMGPDFIYGMISSIDGERDPRNLILLFDVLPNFLKQFTLGHLTEEMFEVIACYFPVDFNPSGSEGTGITRDDLAEKLAPCLCAIPQFAEFCLPLIIEKLFSSLRLAKIDALNLLCKGAQVFRAKHFEQHITELWSAIRKEVMPGGDVELRDAGLKATMAIIEGISDDTKLRESFIDKIITDARSSLCDVQLSLYRPAEKLLMSVAMVDKQSCIQVLQVVIPLCLGQYSTKTSIVDKVILIETLNNFIKISFDHGFSIKSVPELAWTDIPQLYLNELSTENVELKSKILVGLTIQKTHLNSVHRNLLYDQICTLIETSCDSIKTICHNSILAFAMLYPSEISVLVKEKLSLTTDKGNIDIQIRKLEALSAVAKTRELGVDVLPEIVSAASTANFQMRLTALTCLHRLVATKNVDYDIQSYLYNNCNIIDTLFSLNIDPMDHRLDSISNIIRLIVKNLTLEEQQDIVNRYGTMLTEKIPETDAALIMNIFIPLRRNVDVKIIRNLLETLNSLALRSASPTIRQTTCKLIAVIINKTDDNDECFRETLSYFEQKINEILESNADIDTKQATVILQLWLTKAIVTKGFHNAEVYLNNLMNTLRHDEVGQYVAREYKILTHRHEDILIEENSCNVKIFYKQRIFQHLIQHNSEFKESGRQNYLTALTYLLEEVPMELLFMHLTKLVPLLIESLSLDNEQLIFSTLITLKILLETKHDIFTEKAQCFIPRFLKLCTYETMRVRISALECLTNYCNYPVTLIITYKQDVLETLITTLDDRKRLVRKAAVKARTQWFLVGSPGGIKDR